MLNSQSSNLHADRLESAIADRTAIFAVIGLGHVGLPLAAAIASTGFRRIGFDAERDKIGLLRCAEFKLGDEGLVLLQLPQRFRAR